MSYYLLALSLLAGLVYIGFTGQKFAALVQQDKAVRPELVKSTLFRLVGIAIAMGICMDKPFKTYGLFTVINTALVGGSFLFSVELKKKEYQREKDE